MKKLIVSIFVLVLYVNALQASDSLSLSNLSIDQGLSNNSVRCIYQDHNGFMWFGTYDGLNRYDGYEFKVFRNQLNDSNSLPHNYIYTIEEDSHNNLWVGTGQGIGIYNTLNSKFSPAYYIPWQSKKQEKIASNINIIKRDGQGNLFIGTNGWGLLVQKNNTAVAQQIPCTSNAGKTGTYNVQTCTIDKHKKVWLFLADVGLCSYDYTGDSLFLENTDLKSGYSIRDDDEGNLWIGSNQGLYKYAEASKKMTKVFDDVPGHFTSNVVESMILDKQQNLWLGTEGGGIDIFNIAKNSFSYILPGQEKGMLTSESVYSIYQDKESRIWIGTTKGGIDIIEPQKKRFQSFSHNPFNQNSLVYNFVSSFCEDENKILWIGTDGGGLSIWNRQTNHFSNFQHNPNDPNSLSGNLVSCIRKDFTGNFWIATYGGGISKYNKASNSFEHFKCINTTNGEENKSVWLIYQDRDKKLWATTFAMGRVYTYNRLQNRFEMFDNELTDIISLVQDDAGKMWAGNSHQLIQIGKNGLKHQYFEIGKPIRSIYEDATGNFWLGTEGGGLILFDRAEGKITARYSDANGLCNNSVLNIMGDNNGNLWLSTFNGLSEFNVSKKSFKNYFKADGLQSNQFLYNAALKLQSNELVFGGIKGFTIFNPDSLAVRNTMPSIFITKLLVDGKQVAADEKMVTKINGSDIKELTIPFDEAVLSVDFAALEYSAPEKISFAYFLENWDKGWNYTGLLRTANYTHLKEGTYILHINNTNAAGEWNSKETTLRIIVLPPWYRSWWAYLFYCFIAAFFGYLYISYKNRENRLQYEVKLAHIETEKEKELNEKKLSFFTDMSHEFRTPLTLIINPIKDLLKKADKNSVYELGIVYRNAKRLLSLVDQLLLFRKVDSQASQLIMSQLNYSALCREVYLCFSQEAKSRDIDYVLRCPENLHVMADRQKIEIALYNLLSNAIKYTPNKGSISFEVTDNNKDIVTLIKDSGPGISNEAGDKIFEKFYQDVNGQSTTKPGFGIGLYLAKNVVESHQGTIHYQSINGKETKFVLTLPKGGVHVEPQVNGVQHDLPTTMQEPDEIPLPINEKETDKQEDLVTQDATILIVDDNEQMRNYIVGIFSEKYKTFYASNGEEGLQIAKDQLPDLIISDIVMDKMDGMDLCQRIKKDLALGHIPVVLLTGSASPEGKLKGIEFGADDYITKPFEKDLLVAKVANLLKNRSALQNYFFNEITLQKNSLKVSEEYKIFLEKCIAIVEAHLEDDRFTIQTLASEIGMSHSNLYKKVKSISGQSVNSFIRFIRLRKAAEMFINTNLNINETAFSVGMTNVKYFREQFNKLFGVNPSEYIKKYRKAFGSSFRLNKDVLGDD